MKIKNFLISLIAVLAVCASITACANNASTSSAASSSQEATSQQESSISSVEEVKSAEPADITNKIMNDIGIKFPSMVEVKSERLDQYYDVNVDDIESFSAFFCGSGAYPDEVSVFKLKSEDKVDDAKAALEKRVETQTKTYQDYKPDEMYKIDGKNIVTKGCYVAIIISSDNTAAIDAFNSSIG